MNETMGTLLEIVMKRLDDIEKRIATMETTLGNQYSISTVIPEPKYGDYIHSVNKEMK